MHLSRIFLLGLIIWLIQIISGLIFGLQSDQLIYRWIKQSLVLLSMVTFSCLANSIYGHKCNKISHKLTINSTFLFIYFYFHNKIPTKGRKGKKIPVNFFNLSKSIRQILLACKFLLLGSCLYLVTPSKFHQS